MKLPVTAGVGLSAGSRLLRSSSPTFPHSHSHRSHYCRRPRPHYPWVRRHGDGGLCGECSGGQGNRPGWIRQGCGSWNTLQQPQLRCWGRLHLRSEILLREENLINDQHLSILFNIYPSLFLNDESYLSYLIVFVRV